MTSSIGHCTKKLLTLLAGTSLIFVDPLLAQSAPGIPVDVPWSGTQPDRVELRGPAAPVKIDFDAAANRFRGQYPRSADLAASEDVVMIGRWQNRDDRVLFLRIYPDMRAVNLQLLRQFYAECRKSYLDPLQAQANDREGALEAYYRARALYTLDNENQCRGERKKAAARAWFNRSFELTMTDCLFRLNPEAARAYSAYDQAYVAGREKAARARAVQCSAQARNRLWSRGEHAAAYAVGNRLIAELRGDPALQALAVQHFAVAQSTFEAEQKRLGSYLTAYAASRGQYDSILVNAASTAPYGQVEVRANGASPHDAVYSVAGNATPADTRDPVAADSAEPHEESDPPS